jgi:hypothetical protein
VRRRRIKTLYNLDEIAKFNPLKIKFPIYDLENIININYKQQQQQQQH